MLKWTLSTVCIILVFINATNGLLLLSVTISFQQSCLEMAIFKYTQGHTIKITYIWILFVYSHTLFASILILDNYLIIKKKLVTQKQKLGKSAARCV